MESETSFNADELPYIKPKKSIGGFFKFIFGYIKSLFFILFLILLLVGGIVLIIFLFNGKIYIEVVIILFLIYMFIFWKIWFHYSKKSSIKKYNPEKDLARLAEEKRKQKNIYDEKQKQETRKGNRQGGFNGRVEEAEPAVGVSDAGAVRPEQLEGRQLLPKADVSAVRKNRSGIRKILGRRRRRK